MPLQCPPRPPRAPAPPARVGDGKTALSKTQRSRRGRVCSSTLVALASRFSNIPPRSTFLKIASREASGWSSGCAAMHKAQSVATVSQPWQRTTVAAPILVRTGGACSPLGPVQLRSAWTRGRARNGSRSGNGAPTPLATLATQFANHPFWYFKIR